MKIFKKKKVCCIQHDWIRANESDDPYIRFSLGSSIYWVCKKCGKIALFPDWRV